MPAARYCKKPVVISAIEYTGFNGSEVEKFAEGLFRELAPEDQEDGVVAEVWDKFHNTWIGVKLDNYIIRGSEGEFYPHEGELFRKNYEEVADGS